MEPAVTNTIGKRIGLRSARPRAAAFTHRTMRFSSPAGWEMEELCHGPESSLLMHNNDTPRGTAKPSAAVLPTKRLTLTGSFLISARDLPANPRLCPAIARK